MAVDTSSGQICAGQMIHTLIKSLCESFDTLSHVAFVGDVKLNLARSLYERFVLEKVFFFRYESSPSS